MKKIFQLLAVATLGVALLWSCEKEKSNMDNGGGDDEGEVVASLAESFESFTAGSGGAYMGSQAESKGWLGVSISGSLQPDVREFNDNKYVQFSAHRNSGVAEGDVQEFWLISPRLDLDAAAKKTLSFDIAVGYYQASTMFEVYIMDGSEPSTATKTKLTYLEPTNKPTNGYGAFASSGEVDLAAYSGIKRIGFYYNGTSGSGNSTTYQLDNVIFGGGAISTLTVSPSALDFVQAGGSKTFAVNSNTTWSASSDNTNFTVSVNSDSVTVTATANSDMASRSATITVATTDSSVVRTVSCTQEAGEPTGTVVFSENFDGFEGGKTGAGANSKDVSAGLDTITQQTGWTGSKVYEAAGTAKMGTASALGWIQTPAINLSGNDGKYIVVVKSMVWKGDATSIKVYANGTEVSPAPIQGLNNSDYTLKSYTFALSGGTATTNLRFEGVDAKNGRFFLEDLKIYQ